MKLSPHDEQHLRRAIELSSRALQRRSAVRLAFSRGKCDALAEDVNTEITGK
jgi:hypothetical protein